MRSAPKKNIRAIVIAVSTVMVFSLWIWVASSSGKPGGVKEPELFRPPHYDDTYPLSKPTKNGRFRIGVITDLDENSKVSEGKKDAWKAFFKRGWLDRQQSGQYLVSWDTDEVEVRSHVADGGRGMELSELVVFNGALVTCDDRTGIVSELAETSDGSHITAVPRAILMEGSGDVQKGLKCEWMAVKDGYLYVGGFGKEYTTDGKITSTGPLWIKVLNSAFRVEHVDWTANYEALRQATGTSFPGYLLHESAYWHSELRQWFFLPRRVSTEPYDEDADQTRGSNLVLSTDVHFSSVVVRRIGEVIPSHGFSSFKFVPGSKTDIVALKSVELPDVVETYIMVFNLDGKILLEETRIGPYKFEGVEFI